jgi:K+-transporting ATPase KdpF subunit
MGLEYLIGGVIIALLVIYLIYMLENAQKF